MKLRVRFMTLSGKFDVHHSETFESTKDALEAVKKYAESEGYTNIKQLEDEDSDPYFLNLRYTGRTPGGRGGRNVAFAEDAETVFES